MPQLGTREVGFFGNTSGGSPSPTNPTLQDVIDNGNVANRGFIVNNNLDKTTTIGKLGTITNSDPLVKQELDVTTRFQGLIGVTSTYDPYLKTNDQDNEQSLGIGYEQCKNINFIDTNLIIDKSIGIKNADNGTTTQYNDQLIYLQNKNLGGALIPTSPPCNQITSTPYYPNTINEYSFAYITSTGNYNIYFDNMLNFSITRLGLPPLDKNIINLFADFGATRTLYGISEFNDTNIGANGGLITLLRVNNGVYSSKRSSY